MIETKPPDFMEKLMGRVWPTREWTGWADFQHGIRYDLYQWYRWHVAERVLNVTRPKCPGCGCRPVSKRYDQRLSHQRHCPNGPRAQGLVAR